MMQARYFQMYLLPWPIIRKGGCTMKFPITHRERKVNNLKNCLCFLFCLIIIIPVGCKEAGDVYSPKEWIELFEKAGGWTPLTFPDSKYRPGAIISVPEDGDPRFIDVLESCGFPIKDFIEHSYIPSITFEKEWEFKGSALINFKGISAGPKFSKISKTRMEINDHGADAIRLIQLRIWIENPDHRSTKTEACMDELTKPNSYLITEAFRVSSGKYTLYDKSGASIKLETPILKSLLQFQPDVKYEVTSDGSLVIEQPAYFAVRKAQRIEGDFEVLGGSGSEPESADAKIKQHFIKAHAIE